MSPRKPDERAKKTTRKSAKKTARKSAKKTARKSAKKTTRKSAKKTARRSAKKTTKKTARKPAKKTATGKLKSAFVTRENGTRFYHDLVCAFAIGPFVPLIQKLVDVWVMPASNLEKALHRLLNPGSKTTESAHYRTVGRELFEWGYYTDALDCFEQVLRVQPDDLEVLDLKIASHENIGEPNEARAWKKRVDTLRRRRPTGQRYLLDTFVDALVSNAVDAVTRHRSLLTGQVVGIKLGLQEAGSIVPDELWLSIEGSTDLLELSLTLPDTLIPWHVDRLRGLSLADDPLRAFTQRFGIDQSIVGWTDPTRAPASLFRLELGGAVQRTTSRLTDVGIDIAAGCTLTVGDQTGDVVVVDGNRSRQRAREQAMRSRITANLTRFPGLDAVESFAWLCYQSPERRQWLIDLVDGSRLGQ